MTDSEVHAVHYWTNMVFSWLRVFLHHGFPWEQLYQPFGKLWDVEEALHHFRDIRCGLLMNDLRDKECVANFRFSRQGVRDIALYYMRLYVTSSPPGPQCSHTYIRISSLSPPFPIDELLSSFHLLPTKIVAHYIIYSWWALNLVGSGWELE